MWRKSGPVSWRLQPRFPGNPLSFLLLLCAGFVTLREQMATQAVAIPSPTPSHGTRQRKGSFLLIASEESAAPFPGIPMFSEGLGSGGPPELGEPHIQMCLEESLSPCHPSIISNSTPCHWKHFSLDDRAQYGHLLLNRHRTREAKNRFTWSWVRKDSQNKTRMGTSKAHRSWVVKSTGAHCGRCDEVDSLSWTRNILIEVKLKKPLREDTLKQFRPRDAKTGLKRGD